MTGPSAYYYTRYRDCNEHYTAGKRLNRQKQYLSKAAEQTMTAVKNDVGVIVDVYNIGKEYIVTDLSIDEMTYIATEAAGYTLGNTYSPEGTVDTSSVFERFYLDTEKFERMIIDIFYEEVN